MKKILDYTIIENTKIAQNTYKLVLSGPATWVKPGQFMNITIANHYLKRPLSICDVSDDTLTIIYKVVGAGTAWLSDLTPSTKIKSLIGLGNGFILPMNQQVLVVGGGVGIPPLYYTTKELIKKNNSVTVILGFTSQQDAFYIEEFKSLGCEVIVCTNDGSLGEKGFVTEAMIKHACLDKPYFICGPHLMLKAVVNLSQAQGQVSLEERMGCGFGACMGCSHQVKSGSKRVCVEGPVFQSEELQWKD